MSLPLVAVDIGNTMVKFGVVEPSVVRGIPGFARIVEFRTAEFDSDFLSDLLPAEPHAWRVASVHRPAERRLAAWVAGSRPGDDYRLLGHQDLPIVMDVEFPDRVGMDRLVAAVAANHLRDAKHPAIVVDAGTAITVDAVNASGAFLGGVILPGFRMTAHAMAHDTDLLPVADATFPDAPPSVIGKSTVAAIRSGIFWGGVGAVRELVTRIGNELDGEPQLFVTGGDAELLIRFVHRDARFFPELALAGIVWAVR